MKKRLLALLLTLLCLSLPLTAQADIIWEPIGNAFYEKHRDDCEYVNKGYVAPAGTKGYTNPTDPVARWTCEEELILNIGHSYDFGGNVWGVTDIRLGGGRNATTLWIDLDTMIPIYNSLDFQRDHAGDIKEYAGEMDALDHTGKELVFWSYPGSASVSHTFPCEGEFTWTPTQTYTDIEGRLWVLYPYVAGMRNGWLYAEDPYSEEPVYLKDIEDRHTRIEAGRQLVQEEDKPKGSSLLPVIGVLTLVNLVVVVLIIALFRNRRK